MNSNNYLKVIYNYKDKPLTEYPNILAKYLITRFDIKIKSKILDLGCGRGDFLNGFINCGLKGYGVDISPEAIKICDRAQIKVADLEKNKIPFPDNFFDVVFSKSFIEHSYHPENPLKDAYRVLKPNGIIITMCPSWEYCYKIYFEDFTHRTPFMYSSLRDIHKIIGFEGVKVEFFRQIPVLWKYKGLVIFAELIRLISPNFLKKYSKFVRFSKEVMLIGYGFKPQNIKHD